MLTVTHSTCQSVLDVRIILNSKPRHTAMHFAAVFEVIGKGKFRHGALSGLKS